MYVVVEHEISDAEAFWGAAEEGMGNLPADLKIHQVLPSEDRMRAICLWEAASVDDVQRFLEEAVGPVSTNSYFAVEAENAIGLPSSVRA